MRVGVLSIAVLALSLIAGTVPAGATGATGATGSITGVVACGTKAAAPLGPVDVSLHTMTGGSEETAAPVTVKTDAAGTFAFAGLSTDATTAYVVSVNYKGVRYASDVVAFTATEPTRTANVTVYDTTDSDAAISFKQQHLIVTPDGESGVLRVVEIAIVDNAGDRTLVAKEEGAPTVRLVLPADAYDVDFVGVLAAHASLLSGGVAYTGPLAPGQTQLVVGYVVNYPRAYDLAMPLPFAASAVDVLVDDVGVRIQSDVLSGPVPVSIGDKQFVRLSGRDLPAGTVVTLRFSGGVGASGTATAASLDSYAPLGLVALALLTVYLLFGSRLRRPRIAAVRARTRPANAKAEVDEDEELPET